MLTARAALWRQYLKLHKLAVGLVARDEVCRRFMAIPGVGPVTALTFSTAIDDPSRFRRSRDVAAYFGLTSKRWQSGASIDVQGRISKAGDPDVRRALDEAASAMLTRYKGKTAVKSWGQKIAKRCHKKAAVAVARKLAVIMHAMRRDGTAYADRPRAAGAARTAKERKLLGVLAWRSGVRSTANRRSADAQGDPLRRMRTGADHGLREARYLACGRSDPGPRSNA